MPPAGRRATHRLGVCCLCLLLLLSLPLLGTAPGGFPLFNGEDFSGITFVLKTPGADPAKTWTIEDGVLRCTGKPAGYFRTDAPHQNYRLTYEWRFPDGPGNSGVLVHIQEPDEVWPKSIESQLQAKHAGDLWVIGGADFREHTDLLNRRVTKQEKSSEKPLGEWNQGEIICRDDTLKTYVNGVLQNAATGLNISSGYIGFQSEGVPVDFRNIRLHPLDIP